MSKPAVTEFKPYISADTIVPEFTLRAVVLGALLGIVFGAVTVYLALRAGLTVSASIPVAVLSISIFKWLGKSTILENNIVQTTGSAGESIAAGVVFTIPALIFLGFSLGTGDIPRVLVLALVGSILGVLFMVPLRHQLNVAEHGSLTYPEGTACADVLIAGEKGGSFAGKVFGGFGLGLLYKLLNEALLFWRPRPIYQPAWHAGATIAADVTPEYLGVGYIIGPKTAGMIFAGGVLSWLVTIPMIKFFGSGLVDPIFPGTIPIRDMDAFAIWRAYIRPIGAGSVAMAGLFTLSRTLPTIVRALRSTVAQLRQGKDAVAEPVAAIRTERELPGTVIFGGSLVMILIVWFLLAARINPDGGIGGNMFASTLVVIFGFLFVTVSARIVGLIGASANPISGMTIATLMLTSLLFVAVGWTGGSYPAAALSVGGIVCIASAVGGATSQSLKSGFLVGATPRNAEIAMIVGALTSVLVVGFTLILLNRAYTRIEPQVVENIELTSTMKVVGEASHEGKTYQVINVIGSRTVPDGRYFYDPPSKRIEYQERVGIGSERLPAPQAVLMSTVINGILRQSLPWGLVLLGIFIVVVMELCGIRSLAFAVGTYLPIATTAPIFCGGVVNWLLTKVTKREEGEVSSGALFAAGLIAGGSIGGLILAAIVGFELEDKIAIGTKYWPGIANSSGVGILVFIALAGALFAVGRKKLE
ncbi:MAG: oligopeptide transporter, OPT family [Acidobacteria bacterium]|nr:oligopeptide transporter, OPT family [Acidobacteriota bacterium]